MINKRSRRPVGEVKPIDLYEAELVDRNDINPMRSIEPRHTAIYIHLTIDEAKSILQHLAAEIENHKTGTILLPLYGREV